MAPSTEFLLPLTPLACLLVLLESVVLGGETFKIGVSPIVTMLCNAGSSTTMKGKEDLSLSPVSLLLFAMDEIDTHRLTARSVNSS